MTATAFVFKEDTPGLPDHMFIDFDRRKPMEGVIRTALGYSGKRQGDAASKIMKKRSSFSGIPFADKKLTLINHYAAQNARRMFFALESFEFINHIANKAIADYNWIARPILSPELMKLAEYAPEAFDECDKPFLCYPLYEFGCFTENADNKEGYVNVVAARKAAAYAAQKLLDEIEGGFVNESNQNLYAELTCLFATVVNPDVFNDALALWPELIDFYDYSLNYMARRDESQKTVDTSDAAVEVTFDGDPNRTPSPCDLRSCLLSLANADCQEPAASSHDEFMVLIDQAVMVCREEPGVRDHIAALSQTTGAYLEWMDNLPEVDFTEGLYYWVKSIYLLGQSMSLPMLAESEGEATWKAIESVWGNYFINNSGFTKESLADQYEAMSNRTVEHIAELNSINEAISSSNTEIDELEKVQPSTNLEERKLSRKINALKVAAAGSSASLLDAQDEAYAAIIPEGADIDEFFDAIESDNSFDIGDLPEEAGEALLDYAGQQNEQEAPPEADSVDCSMSELDKFAELAANEDSAENNEPAATSEDDADIAPEEDWAELAKAEEAREAALAAKAPEPDVQEEALADVATLMTDHGDLLDVVINEDTEPQISNELQESIVVSAGTANSLITRMVGNNKLEFAAELSHTLETGYLCADHLPVSLLKAAYYGNNTWDDRDVFDKSRRLLIDLSSADLSRWRLTPNSEIAPYLLFLACFQPAVFGGNSSTATTLLRDHDLLDSILDENTKQLVSDTIELSNRGERVTLKSLRSAGKEDSEEEFDTKSLESWAQLVRETRKGYAPVLKATSHSLDHGILGVVESIIRNGEKHRTNEVVSFIDDYSAIEATSALMLQILDEIGVSLGEGITKMGHRRFHSRIRDLIDISRDWLASVQVTKGTHSENYARRFQTRLLKSIEHFVQLTTKSEAGSPVKVGAQLIARQFKHIYNVVHGETPVNKRYERIKSWYYHPAMIMSLDDISDDHAVRVRWLEGQADKPFKAEDILVLASLHEHTQLAYLMQLYLEDQNYTGNMPDIMHQFMAYKKQLVTLSSHLEGQLENAILSGLIDDVEGELRRVGLSEVKEAIEQLEPIDDSIEIKTHISELEEEIQKRTASTKNELGQRYQKALVELQSGLGDDAVPERWIQNMDDAFSSDNLPVVNELLEELEDSAEKKLSIELIEENEIKDVSVLRDFLSVEKTLFDCVSGSANRKEFWHRISEGGKSLELDFGNTPQRLLRNCIDTLFEWKNHAKPKASPDKVFLDKLSDLLNLAGIKPSAKGNVGPSLGYQVANGFISLSYSVDPSPSVRPFEIFGNSKLTHNLPIIIATKAWSYEHLKGVIESHGVNGDLLLISAVPLSPEARQEFSRSTKKNNKTVYLLDMVTLLFLAAQPHSGYGNKAIQNFLWLAAPFTYFNPYSGTDAARPTVHEMCYGRESEIESLLKMRNGGAIVFGGRQLGKSSILRAVETRYHDPDKGHYAFYQQLDKDLLQKMQLNETSRKDAANKIWGFLYRELDRLSMMPSTVSDLGPDNNDQIEEAVKNALLNRPKDNFIVIFDEIDPILNVDSAFDFSIFRSLRNLIEQQGIEGRLKIIIGGLANVKRFENSPNYPLTQMGGSIQVSIMPHQEALHLIIEPMRAAGYHFDTPQVANQILAITNRHPGLIQYFCHALIDSVASNNRQPVGSKVITAMDVNNVRQQDKIKVIIRNRFDMTLALDKRYKVIVYSLIADHCGAQPFTPARSKACAEDWLPEAFSNISETQFEAFLIELVGLGVLKEKNSKYSLRNTNVLKLLTDGHGNDAYHELERAMEGYQSDPLDRHSFANSSEGSSDSIPSPITCRDEKAILGIQESTCSSSPLRAINMKKLTVSVVSGSEALGFNHLMGSLPLLLNDEKPDNGKDNPSHYQTRTLSSSEFSSPADFQKKLQALIVNLAKKAPQMLFVNIDNDTTAAQTMALIDTAHNENNDIDALKHPVRILFLMGPTAYFNWVSAGKLTQSREALQPFIKLSPWTDDAIKTLLERLSINDSDNDVEKVSGMSDGWYFSLEILTALSKKHKSWKLISDFNNYKPIAEADKRKSLVFLKATGLTSNPVALKVLEQIQLDKGIEPFDTDDLQLTLEEVLEQEVSEETVDAYKRWFVDLYLIKRDKKNATDTSGKTYFKLSDAMNHVLEQQHHEG
jgi:hypothetical protein